MAKGKFLSSWSFTVTAEYTDCTGLAFGLGHSTIRQMSFSWGLRVTPGDSDN